MSDHVDASATEIREIDRFEDGVGWIAHPEEAMQRASHAIAVDGDVWIVDPVDGDGVDELLADLGEVAGVVVGIDRHTRDSDTFAERYDVPVYLPTWFEGVAADLDPSTPIVRFDAELADSGIEAYVLRDGRFWQEVALYEPRGRTLLVPEALGTAPHYCVGGERLGVHPLLRAVPPRDVLGMFEPDRILVGHGDGVDTDAQSALDDALAGSRRRLPLLYAKSLRRLAPF